MLAAAGIIHWALAESVMMLLNGLAGSARFREVQFANECCKSFGLRVMKPTDASFTAERDPPGHRDVPFTKETTMERHRSIPLSDFGGME